jgi:SAM-dependent methyltransferase
LRQLIRRTRTKAHITVSRGEQLPFADHSFDVIFSHEVIEHVDDDRRAAQKWCALAPRGRIVLFAPIAFTHSRRTATTGAASIILATARSSTGCPTSAQPPRSPCQSVHRPGLRSIFARQPVRAIHHQVIYPWVRQYRDPTSDRPLATPRLRRGPRHFRCLIEPLGAGTRGVSDSTLRHCLICSDRMRA